MATELVTQDDVESVLLRSLTSAEQGAVNGNRGLIAKAESQLRFRRPTIDDEIAAGALDPLLVGDMLAGVIKRVLINPKGLWSTSETDGDYSYSETYPGARAGSDAGSGAADLVITAADLAKLRSGDGGPRQIRTSPLPYPNVTRGLCRP